MHTDWALLALPRICLHHFLWHSFLSLYIIHRFCPHNQYKFKFQPSLPCPTLVWTRLVRKRYSLGTNNKPPIHFHSGLKRTFFATETTRIGPPLSSSPHQPLFKPQFEISHSHLPQPFIGRGSMPVFKRNTCELYSKHLNPYRNNEGETGNAGRNWQLTVKMTNSNSKCFWRK